MPHPRLHVGSYWRWDGSLWRLVGVTWNEGNPEDGDVQLAGPTDDARWVTVDLSRFLEEGELVWTEHPPPDKTLEALREHRDQLHGLRDLAHAVRVLRSDPYLSALGQVIEDQADALQRAVGHVVGFIARERFRERDASRNRLNDELGIPNCDHVIRQEDCPECAKGSS